jgi:hypothetical protein
VFRSGPARLMAIPSLFAILVMFGVRVSRDVAQRRS